MIKGDKLTINAQLVYQVSSIVQLVFHLVFHLVLIISSSFRLLSLDFPKGCRLHDVDMMLFKSNVATRSMVFYKEILFSVRKNDRVSDVHKLDREAEADVLTLISKTQEKIIKIYQYFLSFQKKTL